MSTARRDILSIGLKGHDQLNAELGGGFPPGSIVLMEGDYGAGKSALSQRFSYGFTQEDTTVTYLSTELTVSGFIDQMHSLSYDVTSELLEEQLLFLSADFDSGGALRGNEDKERKELLKRLMDAEAMWEPDVIIIDTFDAILRDGRVVLSGNDPYFYLYWTEELSRQSAGVIDRSALTAGSFGLLKSEPLLVAVLWVATELVGGVGRAPLVLAWYPVVAGVVTGVFTYLFATGLTGDERVGIASVVMLAVMPVLAFRSGLGFADHHAFDYVWLSMTAAGAVRSVRAAATREAATGPRVLAWTGLTGVAIAGQLLAWEAGPLLLVPVASYVPVAALIAVDRDESPGWTLAPLGVGLAVAAVLTGGAHLALDWQTGVVAATPALLLAGTVGVAAVGEVVHRVDDLPVSPVRALAAAEAAGVVLTFGLLTTVLAAYGDRLFGQLGRIGTDGSVVEANSLFGTGTFGWLFLFGLLLFLGVPYMGFALLRATRGEDRHGWLLAGIYG